MKKLLRIGAFASIMAALVFAGCGNAEEDESSVTSNSGDGKFSDWNVNDIVSFGHWPQTIKAADVTITSETKTAGMFTYYKGSDGEWYAKTAENAYESGYSYSDGTTVGLGGTSEKYFKVEPVKWRVLTDNYSGKKLLLAESILVNKRYDASSNNYEDSEIRSWLNEEFLSTAFSADEQADIAVTTVDNSERSTNPDANAAQFGYGENEYACDPTKDKIFLLSEQEVTTAAYGFDVNIYDIYDPKNARIRVTTDFSRASGVWQRTESDYSGGWWLRSPNAGIADCARCVDHDGRADVSGDVYQCRTGVVPALCLK